MKIRLNGRVKRRRAIVSLAAMLAVAGLMWLSMLGGVSEASAHGGIGSGAQGNGLIQEEHEQPPVNACFFFIPC